MDDDDDKEVARNFNHNNNNNNNNRRERDEADIGSFSTMSPSAPRYSAENPYRYEPVLPPSLSSLADMLNQVKASSIDSTSSTITSNLAAQVDTRT